MDLFETRRSKAVSEKDSGSTKPADLEDLDKRLRDARGSDRAPQNPNPRGNAMGLAFRLSTELVAGLVIGGAIGWGLDRLLGTGPWFLLIFFFLGMAAGILNVVRTSQQMNAANSEGETSENETND
jgi:ATP synthase protein I